MKVLALRFENFRNLKRDTIYPGDFVNVIYGDNAQGKTNLLEALWFFCGGHSFRGAKDSEVIGWGKSFARLEMQFFGQEREQNAQITFEGNRKKVSINSVPKKSTASLIEKFCAVVFAPDHLGLIKRGPSQRRRFIDSAICRERLSNAVLLAKYNRLLSQRNALLKDINRRPSLKDTIYVWDEPLAKYSAALIRQRLDYVRGLSRTACEYHCGISRQKEMLEIRYVSTAGAVEDDTTEQIEQKLRHMLEENLSTDIRAGVTSSGAHRDDIEILINGKSARTYASQGQQRSAVLSLKLAEAGVLREKMGENPVILLDDVLSELDFGRQSFLLNELRNCQVFITSCEPSGRDLLRHGRVYNIANGEIS